MRTDPNAVIAPWAFARDQGRRAFVVSGDKLARLGDAVVRVEGNIDVEVAGEPDVAGRPGISGHVRATVVMTCQRCFGDLALVQDRSWVVALHRPDEPWQELGGDVEPLTVEGEDLDLLALAEDELLLSLPIAPLHDDLAECRRHGYQADASEPTSATVHPFAALAALKRNRDTD